MNKSELKWLIRRLTITILVAALLALLLVYRHRNEAQFQNISELEETEETSAAVTEWETSPLSNVLPTDDPMVLPQDDEYLIQPAKDIQNESAEIDGEAVAEEAEDPVTWNGITEGNVYNGMITHYDACVRCTGSTVSTTASGMKIWNGMEDPHIASCNWLPLGSVVEIGGIQYTIADRGGSGLNTVGRVDIFVPAGHQTAVQAGIQYTSVKVIKIA